MTRPTRPTLADARRLLQTSGRIDGLAVTWDARPRFVTYPTGAQGWDARVSVQAPGYRARVMLLQRDAQGTGIR